MRVLCLNVYTLARPIRKQLVRAVKQKHNVVYGPRFSGMWRPTTRLRGVPLHNVVTSTAEHMTEGRTAHRE